MPLIKPRRPQLRRPREAPPVVVSRRVPRTVDGPPVEIVDHRRTLPEALRQAWADKRALGWLSMRIAAKGFAGMRLGRSWIALRPALDLGGKTLLFGAVFSAPSKGAPYFLFLVAGMVCWRLFQMGFIFGSRCTQYLRRHMKGLYISPLLAPLAATGFGLLDFAVYGVILAGTIGFYAITDGHLYLQTGPELLLAPVAVGMVLLTTWALAYWLAVIVAYVQDIRVALRYVVSLGILVTPVIYPVSFVPEGLRGIALANPLTPPIELFKYATIGAGDVLMTPLLVSFGSSLVLLVGGVWFLNRHFEGAMASMTRSGGSDLDDELI